MKKVALSALVIAASGAYVWSQSGSTSDPLLASANLQTGSISTLASAGGNTKLAPSEAPFVTPATPAPAAPTAPAPAPSFTAQASAGGQALPQLPAPSDSSGFGPSAAQTSPNNAAPAPTAPVAVADAQAPAAAASDQPATGTIPLPRLRPPYHQQVAAAAPTPAPASAPSSSSRSAAVSPVVRIAAATSGLSDGTYRGPVVNAYYGLMQIEAVVRNGHLATIHVLRYPNTHSTSIYINRRALPELRDEVISAQSARVNIVSGATLSSHAFIQSLGGALRKARV